jgi:hypothetical protein
MSSLHLNLKETGQPSIMMSLTAQAVIETTLFLSPQRANLPTLVSTENIIAKINNHGYALADEGEIAKISKLVNNYYLPTEKSSWQDRSLDLNVARIPAQDSDYYKEIQNIRNVMTKAAHDIVDYENRNDYVQAKQAQDNALLQITHSVKAKRNWWSGEKIFKFLAKTAIGAIVDTLLGIPISIVVGSALDGIFDSKF